MGADYCVHSTHKTVFYVLFPRFTICQPLDLEVELIGWSVCEDISAAGDGSLLLRKLDDPVCEGYSGVC